MNTHSASTAEKEIIPYKHVKSLKKMKAGGWPTAAMAVAGALISAGVIALDVRIGLVVTGLVLSLVASWITLIGLAWWRKYSSWYIVLYLLSILSGSVYQLPIGSVHLGLSLSDIFLIPSLVILAFGYRKRRSIGWDGLIALVLVSFWVLVTFRGLVAEQPTRALAGAKSVGSGLLILLVATKAQWNKRATRHRLYPALWIWSIALLVMVAQAIVSTARATGMPFISIVLEKVDYLTPLGRTNYVGALALLLWPISLYGAIAVSAGKQRILGIVGTGALGLVLLLLYSRGALIAFTVTFPIVLLGIAAILRRRRPRARARQPLVFALSSLAVVVIIGLSWRWLQPFAQQAWSLVSSPGSWSGYSTAQSRFALWDNAWQIFTDYPLLGRGLYNVTSISAESGSILFAHNFPLQLLAETGIAGFCLYGLALILVAYRLIQIIRRSKSRYVLALAAGVLVALLVTLVQGLVETNFLTRDFDLLFWGLVGCTFSAARNCGTDHGQGPCRKTDIKVHRKLLI